MYDPDLLSRKRTAEREYLLRKDISKPRMSDLNTMTAKLGPASSKHQLGGGIQELNLPVSQVIISLANRQKKKKPS